MPASEFVPTLEAVVARKMMLMVRRGGAFLVVLMWRSFWSSGCKTSWVSWGDEAAVEAVRGTTQ